MSPAAVLLASASVVLWASFGWTWYQSRRAARRRSPQLLARLLGLLALTMTVSLCVPVLGPLLDPLLGSQAAVLIKNWLSVLDFAAALAFLSYTAGLDGRRVRHLVERGPAAVAIVLMTAGWYASPGPARAGDFGEPDLAPGMVVYWVVGLLYIGFGATVAALLLHRAAAITARRSTVVGLRVAGIGFALVAVFLSVFRLVVMAVGAVGAGIEDAALVVERIGILLIGVGLALPALAHRVTAARIWWRHVRLHRAVEPLWTHLTGAFPELVLVPEPSPWDRWRPGTVHRRFYRRVTECRDGLVLLAPYAPAVTDGDPAGEARAVHAALRAHRSDQPLTDPGPVIADPGSASVSADARRLADLARHLDAVARDEPPTRGRP